MKYKNIILIIGILSFLLLFSITAYYSPHKIGDYNLKNIISPHKFSELNSTYDTNQKLGPANRLENETGCCSVIVHIKPGHDIVSYRRDSGYAADMIIEKTSINGQNAIKEYKVRKGNFTHTIITENGWIISIGGKDNPNTNKQLEKLGNDIISRGNIQKGDIDKANAIIKQNGWGHFVIKSPDDNVGLTAYDSRVSLSTTKLFKMKDGDYVKVPNNPRYYNNGKFNKFSNDPTDAAIKIIGKDIYGQDRRDVITYEYNNDPKKIDIWASFDGGSLLGGVKGKPDNILYMGNEINSNELPKIPGRKFLGEELLQNTNNFNDNLIGDNSELSSTLNNEKLKSYLTL